MKITKLFLGFLALQLFTLPALNAQNGTMTPYSRFGYGMLNDNATAAQHAMGGVGYAMSSGRQINVMNPASYAAADSMTFLFDMGMDITSMWQNETVDGSKLFDRKTGGGLDYITMQVPIGKRMGASFGILPYSSVGYAFGSDITNGTTSREGSGSINQLYLGFAGKIFKGFSAGFNIAYLFGTTYNDSYAYTSSGSTTLFERELDVRDWRLDLGLQYSTYINARNRVNLGVTYSPKKDFNGHAITYAYDMTQDAIPTETENISLKGNFSKSESWGAGLGWEWDGRLYGEVDFTYQPWSKTKYRGVSQDGVNADLNDRYRIGAGLQFVPKPRGGYLERVQYRAGGYFNRDYLRVLGNNIHEYGVSVGVGLPVPVFKTIINLSFGWTHRQANPNPLIKEDYLNIRLGFNINELWFRPTKIY